MELEIPKERWYHLLDKLSRVDELLEVLIKLQELQIEKLDLLVKVMQVTKIPTPTPEVPEVVVKTERVFNNRYKVYKIDLSVARTDEPLGLREKGIVANYMTIIRADAPCTIKINSRTHDPLEASVGLMIENFNIEEIFISNSAQVEGNYLVIYLEWRV